MKPEFGKVYTFTVKGEPVPKSTKRPPRHQAAYHIVQKDQKYKRLKDTWDYQKHVAQSALAAGIPQFDKDDPIRLSLCICKAGRKTGDTKNILAAIEDGLQYGKFIPNDRKVVGYGEIDTFFNAGNMARVDVTLEIYPWANNLSWLMGYFSTQKKAQEYYDRLVKK